MIQVHVLILCKHCGGKAYLPMGEMIDAQGRSYTRHLPCPSCEGSGKQASWICLEEFARLLQQVECPHEHTSCQGSMRFTEGDIWDDIQEVCDDCGAGLDSP